MIFGFSKKKQQVEEQLEEEFEQVLFQGPLSGTEIDLASHERLTEAGLAPSKDLITDVLRRRAEMFRIEPKGDRSSVSMTVDGVPYSGGRLTKQQALAVTQMIKLLSGLDPRERKKPQSGGLKAEFQEAPYELRVESTPVKEGGERLIVRVRNLTLALNTPEDLGFSDQMKSRIQELASKRQGALLVCGPPASGTTTTMYAVLRTIDAYIYAMYSIADTTGHDMSHITEFEVVPDDDLEERIERTKRVEADIVFIDPIRNAETVRTVFKMQQKITILTEFPAQDAVHGLLQLAKWLDNPPLLADGLLALVSQKLIRTLCAKCKEAYPPNSKLIAKVGLPPETKVLYRPPRVPEAPQRGEEHEPCRTCGGIGYFGRAGMYELIEMTDPMKELIVSGASAAAIKQLVRKEGMQTLQAEALRLVATGKTSLEELQRAFKASK